MLKIVEWAADDDLYNNAYSPSDTVANEKKIE